MSYFALLSILTSFQFFSHAHVQPLNTIEQIYLIDASKISTPAFREFVSARQGNTSGRLDSAKVEAVMDFFRSHGLDLFGGFGSGQRSAPNRVVVDRTLIIEENKLAPLTRDPRTVAILPGSRGTSRILIRRHETRRFGNLFDGTLNPNRFEEVSVDIELHFPNSGIGGWIGPTVEIVIGCSGFLAGRPMLNTGDDFSGLYIYCGLYNNFMDRVTFFNSESVRTN